MNGDCMKLMRMIMEESANENEIESSLKKLSTPVDENDRTSLFTAAALFPQTSAIFKILLKHFPLCLESSQEDLKIIKAIIEGDSEGLSNALDSGQYNVDKGLFNNKYTPLTFAVFMDQPEIITTLLDSPKIDATQYTPVTDSAFVRRIANAQPNTRIALLEHPKFEIHELIEKNDSLFRFVFKCEDSEYTHPRDILITILRRGLVNHPSVQEHLSNYFWSNRDESLLMCSIQVGFPLDSTTALRIIKNDSQNRIYEFSQNLYKEFQLLFNEEDEAPKESKGIASLHKIAQLKKRQDFEISILSSTTLTPDLTNEILEHTLDTKNILSGINPLFVEKCWSALQDKQSDIYQFTEKYFSDASLPHLSASTTQQAHRPQSP